MRLMDAWYMQLEAEQVAKIKSLEEEIARLRLTDAEREAIETSMNAYGSDNANPECAAIEATLWGLLERTK